MDVASVGSLARQAEPGEEAVPCVACGGRRFEVVLDEAGVAAEQAFVRRFHSRRVAGRDASLEDRAEFTQSEPTNIVRCVACGTLMRLPRPTPGALRRLYAADTYGQEALESLLANERAFFDAKAGRLAPLLPDAARVLEVGAFVGAFLMAARDRCWRATGVDVGEETVPFMRGMGLDVRQGDVCDVDLPAGAWDAVCIWNTFDQLPDPARVLRRMHALLAPGGLLVLRVPNGAFEAACLELRWNSPLRRAVRVMRAQAYNNFLTFPYLAGYTAESLGRLLSSHGFTVQRVEGDTILPLADENTLPFAAREELRYKRAVMRVCRRHLRRTGRQVAPWLDVVAAPVAP